MWGEDDFEQQPNNKSDHSDPEQDGWGQFDEAPAEDKVQSDDGWGEFVVDEQPPIIDNQLDQPITQNKAALSENDGFDDWVDEVHAKSVKSETSSQDQWGQFDDADQVPEEENKQISEVVNSLPIVDKCGMQEVVQSELIQNENDAQHSCTTSSPDSINQDIKVDIDLIVEDCNPILNISTSDYHGQEIDVIQATPDSIVESKIDITSQPINIHADNGKQEKDQFIDSLQPEQHRNKIESAIQLEEIVEVVVQEVVVVQNEAENISTSPKSNSQTSNKSQKKVEQQSPVALRDKDLEDHQTLNEQIQIEKSDQIVDIKTNEVNYDNKPETEEFQDFEEPVRDQAQQNWQSDKISENSGFDQFDQTELKENSREQELEEGFGDFDDPKPEQKSQEHTEFGTFNEVNDNKVDENKDEGFGDFDDPKSDQKSQEHAEFGNFNETIGNQITENEDEGFGDFDSPKSELQPSAEAENGTFDEVSGKIDLPEKEASPEKDLESEDGFGDFGDDKSVEEVQLDDDFGNFDEADKSLEQEQNGSFQVNKDSTKLNGLSDLFTDSQLSDYLNQVLNIQKTPKTNLHPLQLQFIAPQIQLKYLNQFVPAKQSNESQPQKPIKRYQQRVSDLLLQSQHYEENPEYLKAANNFMQESQPFSFSAPAPTASSNTDNEASEDLSEGDCSVNDASGASEPPLQVQAARNEMDDLLGMIITDSPPPPNTQNNDGFIADTFAQYGLKLEQLEQPIQTNQMSEVKDSLQELLDQIPDFSYLCDTHLRLTDLF